MCDDWTSFEFATLDNIPDVSGIYFLMNGIELVYIGQSKNIKRRIQQHNINFNCNWIVGGKKIDVDTFDSLYYFECDYKPERKEYESMFKEDYSPKHNDYDIDRDFAIPLRLEIEERDRLKNIGIDPDELDRKWRFH